MITMDKSSKAPKTPAKSKVTVSKSKGKDIGQEVVSDALVPVPDAHVTGPVKVGFSIGATKNLGNFESLRVDVSVEVPCGQNLEDIEAAHEFIKDWAMAKLEQAIDKAMN